MVSMAGNSSPKQQQGNAQVLPPVLPAVLPPVTPPPSQDIKTQPSSDEGMDTDQPDHEVHEPVPTPPAPVKEETPPDVDMNKLAE